MCVWGETRGEEVFELERERGPEVPCLLPEPLTSGDIGVRSETGNLEQAILMGALLPVRE